MWARKARAAEAGTTARPLFGGPHAHRGRREGSSWLKGAFAWLPPLVPFSKLGSRQGPEKPASRWGRPAVTSVWGPRFMGPPRAVSGKARPVGFG